MRTKPKRKRPHECVVTLEPAQLQALLEVLPARLAQLSTRASVLVRAALSDYVAQRRTELGAAPSACDSGAATVPGRAVADAPAGGAD